MEDAFGMEMCRCCRSHVPEIGSCLCAQCRVAIGDRYALLIDDSMRAARARVRHCADPLCDEPAVLDSDYCERCRDESEWVREWTPGEPIGLRILRGIAAARQRFWEEEPAYWRWYAVGLGLLFATVVVSQVGMAFGWWAR